jgi:hypothetical protein
MGDAEFDEELRFRGEGEFGREVMMVRSQVTDLPCKELRRGRRLGGEAAKSALLWESCWKGFTVEFPTLAAQSARKSVKDEKFLGWRKVVRVVDSARVLQ